MQVAHLLIAEGILTVNNCSWKNFVNERVFFTFLLSIAFFGDTWADTDQIENSIRQYTNSSMREIVRTYNQGRGRDGNGTGPFSQMYIDDLVTERGLQDPDTTRALQFLSLIHI